MELCSVGHDDFVVRAEFCSVWSGWCFHLHAVGVADEGVILFFEGRDGAVVDDGCGFEEDWLCHRCHGRHWCGSLGVHWWWSAHVGHVLRRRHHHCLCVGLLGRADLVASAPTEDEE